MAVSPVLTYSCPESWDAMKIGVQSRFCDSCQKSVVDFTGKTRQEILQYLHEKKGEEVCGRVPRSAVDYTAPVPPLPIRLSPQASGTRAPFYLLAGSLLLTACQNETRTATGELPEISATDTLSSHKDSLRADSTAQEPAVTPPLPEPQYSTGEDEIPFVPSAPIQHIPAPPPDVLLGIIYEYTPERVCELSGTYTHCHSYPEFPGGAQALRDYLQEQVSKSIKRGSFTEAKVVVQFEVNESGEIKKPRIVNAPEKSKKLQKAVLKSFRRMPNWKPGKLYDDNITVRCTIPFYFTL